MSRSSLLFLHVVGAILLFGSYITAFATKALGERTRDPRILAHVYHVMNRVDRTLTPVSILLLLGTGFVLASRARLPIVGTDWLIWSLALFGVTGVLSLARALPIQHRLERLLREPEMDWRRYERLAGSWLRWAGGSLFLTVVILYLMIRR